MVLFFAIYIWKKGHYNVNIRKLTRKHMQMFFYKEADRAQCVGEDQMTFEEMIPAMEKMGIEKERIPYEKPHYVVGEYDYKLRKSAAVFALSVTKQVESAKKLDYLKYIPELEEINDDTMLEVKSAWAEFKREDCYTSNHQNYLYRGYTENEAKALAEKDANQAAENAYPQLFNGSYFYYYGYLGTFEESVVIASYSFQQLKLIVGEVDFGFQTRIFVYTNEKIVSLQEAYDEKLITDDELVILKNRNEKYIESKLDYYIKQFEQATQN